MAKYAETELEIAFLLGSTPEECAAFLSPAGWGQDCRGWRAAQIASWDVPVACCIRCRRHEFACGGLSCRHTTHRQCWPEAFAPNAECYCPTPYRCSPWPSTSEDAP